MIPIGDFCLMLRAGENSDSAITDRYHGVTRAVGREVTTRTADATGRKVRQDVGRCFAREATSRGELLDVRRAASKGDRKLVEKEKGDGLAAPGDERGLTVVTWHRWRELVLLRRVHRFVFGGHGLYL